MTFTSNCFPRKAIKTCPLPREKARKTGQKGRSTIMKRHSFASVSALALSLAFLTIPAAWSQAGPDPTAPQSGIVDCDVGTPGVQTDCGETERVVITGSNIAGSSESAALPVEVFSMDD